MQIINVDIFFFFNMKYKSHDNFLYNPIPATYKITNKIIIFHKQLQKSKLAVQKFTFFKSINKNRYSCRFRTIHWSDPDPIHQALNLIRVRKNYSDPHQQNHASTTGPTINQLVGTQRGRSLCSLSSSRSFFLGLRSPISTFLAPGFIE